MNSWDISGYLLLNDKVASDVVNHLANLYSLNSSGSEAMGMNLQARHHKKMSIAAKRLHLAIEENIIYKQELRENHDVQQNNSVSE